MTKRNDEIDMSRQVIYEKTYEKFDVTKLKPSEGYYDWANSVSFDNYEEHLTVEPMPARLKAVRSFVDLAVSISEFERYSIKITNEKTSVIARFYISIGSMINSLISLIEMSDDAKMLSMQDDYVIVDFEYYTHRTLYDGDVLTPIQ